MLVYDVNSNRSFDTLNTWHDEFLNQVRMIILQTVVILVMVVDINCTGFKEKKR